MSQFTQVFCQSSLAASFPALPVQKFRNFANSRSSWPAGQPFVIARAFPLSGSGCQSSQSRVPLRARGVVSGGVGAGGLELLSLGGRGRGGVPVTVPSMSCDCPVTVTLASRSRSRCARLRAAAFARWLAFSCSADATACCCASIARTAIRIASMGAPAAFICSIRSLMLTNRIQSPDRGLKAPRLTYRYSASAAPLGRRFSA